MIRLPLTLPPGSMVRSAPVKPAGHREMAHLGAVFTCREDRELVGRVIAAKRQREANFAIIGHPIERKGRQ